MKTVKDAALKLPVRARKPFLEAWKSTSCHDLYEGRIEDYLGVIRDIMQRRKLKIEEITETIDDARKILEKDES